MPAADIVVRVTVILLTALITTRLMRRAAAATRHLVWMLAVVGALLVPIATAIVPEWRVLPGADLKVGPYTNRPTHAPVAPVGADLEVGPSAPVRADLEVGPYDLPVGPAAVGGSIGTAAWLLLAWAFGALVLLGRVAAGIAAVQRLARHAQPADARWRLLLDDASESAGMTRRVRLLVSRDIAVPMTWSGRRPTVLLPVEAMEWTEDRARVVLLHELAHVRRADWSTHALARILAALHWFNPLAWIALSAITSERERACDDFVLARGTRPSDYAQHLLDIARHGFGTSSYVMAPAMARASELEGRLVSILTPHRREPRRLAAQTLTAASVCLTLAVASAAPRQPAPVPTPVMSKRAPAVANQIFQHDDTPEQKREARRSRAALAPLANTALSDESEDAREKATLALAVRSEPAVVDPLLRALKDPSSQVREKAALGLALRRDARVVDSLLEAASDPDSQVREKVAIALGLSGDARAIDALNRALEDPDPQVREKAASGLTLFSISSLARRATTR